MAENTLPHYLKAELDSRVATNPELFEFLYNATLDGIWYWDLEKPENEWMSPGFWKAFGYDPRTKSHLSSEWQDLIHPEDLELAQQNLRLHIADPSYRYDQIVRYRHRLGHWVWVRCRGLVIFNSMDIPIRMIGVHTDLSDLMSAKEQLETQVQRLEAVELRLDVERKRCEQLEREIAELKARSRPLS